MSLLFLTPLKATAQASYSNGHSLALTAASSQYVTMGNVLDKERTDAFSISLWAKLASTGSQRTLVAKQAGASTFRGYVLYSDSSNKLGFDLVNDGSGSNYLSLHSSSAQFGSAVWHHVVLTYSGNSNVSGVTMYIDGSSVAKTTDNNGLSATTANAANFQIGKDFTTRYWDGKVDEVAIWSVELSGSDVTALYNSGHPGDLSVHAQYANLQSWWRLGDLTDSSGTTFDRKGSNDGTLTNSPSYSTDVP